MVFHQRGDRVFKCNEVVKSEPFKALNNVSAQVNAGKFSA